MSVRLVCAAVAICAVDPAAGCKKLLGKGGTDDGVSADPGTTSTVQASVSATDAAAATPAGDALLSLGTGEWINYQPEGPARFGVLLPQRPTETTPPLRLGGISVATRQALAARVGAFYTFVFADLPATVKLDPKATLDAARDEAVKSVPTAVLRGEREIRIGKNLGREFQAEATAPFPITMTAHIYLVGRRLYEQEITVPSSVSEGTYVDKFFGSLAVPGEGTGATMSDSAPSPSPSPSASASASASPAGSGKPPKKKR